MMDTKELYDLANEAGLNFKSEDSSDLRQVAIEAILKDPGYMIEYYIDAMVDFSLEKPDPEKEGYQPAQHYQEAHQRMLRQIYEGAMDCYSMASYRSIETFSAACTATSFTYKASQIGEEVIKACIRWVEAHVDRNLDEWWGDICSYDYDMREGQREDYYYEQAKDRRLEERWERESS